MVKRESLREQHRNLSSVLWRLSRTGSCMYYTWKANMPILSVPLLIRTYECFVLRFLYLSSTYQHLPSLPLFLKQKDPQFQEQQFISCLRRLSSSKQRTSIDHQTSQSSQHSILQFIIMCLILYFFLEFYRVHHLIIFETIRPELHFTTFNGSLLENLKLALVVWQLLWNKFLSIVSVLSLYYLLAITPGPGFQHSIYSGS